MQSILTPPFRTSASMTSSDRSVRTVSARLRSWCHRVSGHDFVFGELLIGDTSSRLKGPSSSPAYGARCQLPSRSSDPFTRSSPDRRSPRFWRLPLLISRGTLSGNSSTRPTEFGGVNEAGGSNPADKPGQTDGTNRSRPPAFRESPTRASASRALRQVSREYLDQDRCAVPPQS